MVDSVLEVAAYVALAVGIALLLMRYVGRRVPRAVRVMRFRRRLRKADDILVAWAAVYRAPISDATEELARRLQKPAAPKEPGRTDPGPTGAAAA